MSLSGGTKYSDEICYSQTGWKQPQYSHAQVTNLFRGRRALNNKKGRLISFLLAAAILSSLAGSLSASDVRVSKTKKGWTLLVDGRPYIIKGLCYWPVKIGESADDATLRDWMITDDDHDGRIDSPYQSWVDKNRNNV